MNTKVFRSGNSLAVRLPKELGLLCGTVSIHREGRKSSSRKSQKMVGLLGSLKAFEFPARILDVKI